jgi:hypothetical protein
MTDDLARACAQFEALMLRQMLMEAGIGRSNAVANVGGDDDDAEGGIALGAGAGADFTQSMFVDALAQAIAGADRSGLGHLLESTLRGTAT